MTADHLHPLLESIHDKMRFSAQLKPKRWRPWHCRWHLSPSPLTELALSTHFTRFMLETFAQSQEATLCFLSSFSSAAILRHTCGKTRNPPRWSSDCIGPAQSPRPAFHDDIHVVSQPEHICELCSILARKFWAHSRIKINGSKTQIWNRVAKSRCLLTIAQQDDPLLLRERTTG